MCFWWFPIGMRDAIFPSLLVEHGFCFLPSNPPIRVPSGEMVFPVPGAMFHFDPVPVKILGVGSRATLLKALCGLRLEGFRHFLLPIVLLFGFVACAFGRSVQ